MNKEQLAVAEILQEIRKVAGEQGIEIHLSVHIHHHENTQNVELHMGDRNNIITGSNNNIGAINTGDDAQVIGAGQGDVSAPPSPEMSLGREEILNQLHEAKQAVAAVKELEATVEEGLFQVLRLLRTQPLQDHTRLEDIWNIQAELWAQQEVKQHQGVPEELVKALKAIPAAVGLAKALLPIP